MKIHVSLLRLSLGERVKTDKNTPRSIRISVRSLVSYKNATSRSLALRREARIRIGEIVNVRTDKTRLPREARSCANKNIIFAHDDRLRDIAIATDSGGSRIGADVERG